MQITLPIPKYKSWFASFPIDANSPIIPVQRDNAKNMTTAISKRANGLKINLTEKLI